jgi:hypothetical protein
MRFFRDHRLLRCPVSPSSGGQKPRKWSRVRTEVLIHLACLLAAAALSYLTQSSTLTKRALFTCFTSFNALSPCLAASSSISATGRSCPRHLRSPTAAGTWQLPWSWRSQLTIAALPTFVPQHLLSLSLTLWSESLPHLAEVWRQQLTRLHSSPQRIDASTTSPSPLFTGWLAQQVWLL